MKQYQVIVGLEHTDGADLIQHACLLSNGQTIGNRSYKNGQCFKQEIIDSADLSLRTYFCDEAHDVCANSPLAQKLALPVT